MRRGSRFSASLIISFSRKAVAVVVAASVAMAVEAPVASAVAVAVTVTVAVKVTITVNVRVGVVVGSGSCRYMGINSKSIGCSRSSRSGSSSRYSTAAVTAQQR